MVTDLNVLRIKGEFHGWTVFEAEGERPANFEEFKHQLAHQQGRTFGFEGRQWSIAGLGGHNLSPYVEVYAKEIVTN